MGAIRCCRDCQERHVNCHSHCEKYLAERAKLDAENKTVFENKANETAAIKYDMKNYKRRYDSKEKHHF